MLNPIDSLLNDLIRVYGNRSLTAVYETAKSEKEVIENLWSLKRAALAKNACVGDLPAPQEKSKIDLEPIELHLTPEQLMDLEQLSKYKSAWIVEPGTLPYQHSIFTLDGVYLTIPNRGIHKEDFVIEIRPPKDNSPGEYSMDCGLYDHPFFAEANRIFKSYGYTTEADLDSIEAELIGSKN